jgi:hypothetical protein
MSNFLLSLLLVGILTILAPSTQAKDFAFILHRRHDYAVDWKQLHSANTRLILVTNSNAFKKLSLDTRALFDRIFIVKNLVFDEVRPKMEKYLEQHFHEGDRSYVAAIAESDVLPAAQLRDFFRTRFHVEGPSADVILNFRNKLHMKALLKDKVKIPMYQRFDRTLYARDKDRYLAILEEYLNYPMFAKPIDGLASIGTIFISDRFMLKQWCEDVFDSTQEYEIDTFIDGDLYHCDSVIYGGRVQTTLIARYLHPNAEARHKKALASMTLDPNEAISIRLKKFAETALHYFPNLPDGVTHMEIFENRHGELIFLEVAARPPGAQAPEMYAIRTNGIDIRLLHLKLSLNHDVTKELGNLADARHLGPYACMYQIVAPPEGGILTARNEANFATKDFFTTWNYQENSVIKPNKSIIDTIASTLLWNKNYTELKEDFEVLDSHVMTTIVPYENACRGDTEKDDSYLDRSLKKLLAMAHDLVTSAPSYFPPQHLLDGNDDSEIRIPSLNGPIWMPYSSTHYAINGTPAHLFLGSR